ncbi:D-alanyl-D-alanine carboxypeptidase family protein [Promicromonospora panici]|uniref:D-alanyl-D-alanine carboxypeptidase family protein n=1 Tax=Promicromonospora panici TaxID=2219658 RepID=UPI001F5E1599|nr:D-alanyl-D-alanine carboxypeptidase family protein [Promicromonospora panici]
MRGAHAIVAEHSPHPLVRRSSFAIAAALASVALTTTAAVSMTATGGTTAGSPGTGAAAEPATLPGAVVLEPQMRSASEKADAVLTDAVYVTREGDLSAKERKRVRAAAQNLRTLVDQARETNGTTAGIRPAAAASRNTDRAPLGQPGADGSTAVADATADGGVPAAAVDVTAPTNLAGTTVGLAPLSEQGTVGLPVLDTPLAEAVDEAAAAREAADAEDTKAPAATGAPSAGRIEKVTTSLQRLITKADGDAVVSVKAGPTPEEIAAAKKAAEERRAARAARSAERKAAQARQEAAARAAEAKAMAEAAKGYGNGQIPSSVLCGLSFSSEQLRCDAAMALEDLNGAFRATFGRSLDVVDGYRSYADQVSVAASRGALAAVPGTSNHGWGQAIDLSGGLQSFGTAEYNWMSAHAGKYGWKHPGWAEPGGSKPEPWHWEYGTSY